MLTSGDRIYGNEHQGATTETPITAHFTFPGCRSSICQLSSRIRTATGRYLSARAGHLAGIYSRVDHERGVHKAPANEVVRGALDVEHQISKNVQDGLNPYGVNCIRFINDNIKVWGARTIGGDANADLKYINVRRVLIFLRESIDRGTQWIVFEPNDRALWAKIVRNVSDFLTNVWRDGALFGSTPQEAFYVKCDDTLIRRKRETWARSQRKSASQSCDPPNSSSSAFRSGRDRRPNNNPQRQGAREIAACPAVSEFVNDTVGRKNAESYAPGVYLESDFNLPRTPPFMTGVPVFLGLRGKPRLRRKTREDFTSR